MSYAFGGRQPGCLTTLLGCLATLVGTGLLSFSAVGTAAPAPEDFSTCATELEAGENDARLEIGEYQIEGNTVLPNIAIERAVYPFLGPGRSTLDVRRACAALGRAYQQAGYLTVVVDIPSQRVDGGIVRLRATEGKIARVRVKGNRYYSQGEIRDQTPALAEGKVPNFPAAQKELAQLSRSEDRRVSPLLRPGEAPGTVDVDLNVQDRLPLHAGVELNNRQTQNTKPLRFSANARYDNLWQQQHSIGVTFQTAPQEIDKLQVFAATYAAPVSDAMTLVAYGVYSNSDVAAVGGTDIIGKGSIGGVRAVFPLPSRETLYHSLSFGADYKDFKESVALQGADSFDTPITYVPVSLQYRITAIEPTRKHEGSVSINGAPRGLFGNNDEEFENKRFQARASYVYLRGDWKTEQRLGSKLSLVGRIQGQLASAPLISNEQFSAGGPDTVRGYLEAEVLGDSGWVGGLELHGPRLAPASVEWIQELFPLAFAEGGVLRILEPLPGQTSRFSLASAGVGLRLKAYQGLSASLDVAYPFEDGTVTEQGHPRLHFMIAYEF